MENKNVVPMKDVEISQVTEISAKSNKPYTYIRLRKVLKDGTQYEKRVFLEQAELIVLGM